MLSWRSRSLDRTMTGMLLQDGGIGRLTRADQAGCSLGRPTDASFTRPGSELT